MTHGKKNQETLVEQLNRLAADPDKFFEELTQSVREVRKAERERYQYLKLKIFGIPPEMRQDSLKKEEQKKDDDS
jgi:hypothetical protein